MVKRRRGRPLGRKSNPDYVQSCAYIPRALRKEVQHLLLDRDLTFSDLVEQLLRRWVEEEGHPPDVDNR